MKQLDWYFSPYGQTLGLELNNQGICIWTLEKTVPESVIRGKERTQNLARQVLLD